MFVFKALLVATLYLMIYSTESPLLQWVFFIASAGYLLICCIDYYIKGYKDED